MYCTSAGSDSRYGRHGMVPGTGSVCLSKSIKGRAASLFCLSYLGAFDENTCVIKLYLVFFTYLAQSRLTWNRADLPSREPA